MKHIFLITSLVAAVAAPAKGADITVQLNAQELARIQSGGIEPMMSPPVAAAIMPSTAPQPPFDPIQPCPACRPASAIVCPPGTQWVSAGYIRRGKWREARCTRIR